MRKDGQTDIRKLAVAFRNFAKARKMLFLLALSASVQRLIISVIFFSFLSLSGLRFF